MPKPKRGGARKRKVTERLDELIRTIVLPQVLGLDDFHLGGIQDEPRQGRKYRAVMTNLAAQLFVALFHTRRIGYLQRVLGDIPIAERLKVRIVCIDMWRPFRLLAQRLFPNALIIIDVFHIVAKANDCLDAVRISVQRQIGPETVRAARRRGITDRKALEKIRKGAHEKELYLATSSKVLHKRAKDLDPGEQEKCRRLCSGEPDLGIAYRLKERFYAIWDEAQNPEQARAMYEQWKQSIPPHQLRYWQKVISPMANWQREIFNYFVEPDLEKRVTNHFTERMVGKVKKINRAGNGCALATIWIKLEQQDEIRERREAACKAERERAADIPVTVSIPEAQASIQSSLRMAARIAKRKRASKRKRPLKTSAVPAQGSLFPFLGNGTPQRGGRSAAAGEGCQVPITTSGEGHHTDAPESQVSQE